MRARGRPKDAPTAENGPGALVRQSQARLWNRIRPKFLHTQGPVARREFRPATQILRAGNPTPSQRGNPRNGGPGVSGPMGTKCPSAASPGDPLVSFPSLGKKLAPQGETLSASLERNRKEAAGQAPPCRICPNKAEQISSPHPSGLTASHLPPKGKALGRIAPSSGPCGPPSPRGKAFGNSLYFLFTFTS